MPYNFDVTPNRHTSPFANKWTLYPKGTLPMWLADMDLPTAPQIRSALRRQVAEGVLG